MVRKKTNVLYYASDGIEDDLNEWQLKTSSSTVVGSVYSLLGEGTDTAWETSTLYELDGNVFKPIDIKMFGSGGWLDSQGYGDVVYANCTKSSSFIRFSSSLYPRLQYAGYMVVPVTETETKYYLPVRKKTETIYATSNGFEGTLYSLQIFQGNGSGTSVYRGYTDTLRIYSDTTWDEAIVYELNSNNNLYYPKNLFGATNSVFADLGYPNAAYNLSASTSSHSCMVSNGGTNAHLSLSSTNTVTLPVTETTQKLYLPVRKSNGTTKYYI